MTFDVRRHTAFALLLRDIDRAVTINHGTTMLRFQMPDGTEQLFRVYAGDKTEDMQVHAQLNHYRRQEKLN